MKFFFDTEFSERGPGCPIQLISIGIVAEDGREFFAHADWYDAEACNDWVKANVLPKLTGRPTTERAEMARAIVAFVGEEKPEFWAYYCAYDWVVLCQVFGNMLDLPPGWPMWCRDLKQAASVLAPGLKLPEQTTAEHDALNDARWTKEAYEWLHRAPEVNEMRAKAEAFASVVEWAEKSAEKLVAWQEAGESTAPDYLERTRDAFREFQEASIELVAQVQALAEAKRKGEGR